MKYIFHHLGMGDHIISNGLVRCLREQYKQVSVFCAPEHFESVNFMYRDDKNIIVVPVGGVSEINKYIRNNNLEEKTIRVVAKPDHLVSWDESFYTQLNINKQNRWDKFKILRDNEREKNLFDLINPKNEKFVLIHSAGSDGKDRIDYSKINESFMKIFVKKYTENIFDFLYLVEKAEEVHCVQSSFHHLVDSLDLNDNIYFHTLKKSRGFSHKIKDKWKIV